KKPELTKRLDAKARESKNPLARLEWGKTVEALQGPQAAIEHFEQAASLEPENADAHQAAGKAYAACNKFDQAIEWYLKAIEADPTLEEAYTNWAVALGEIEIREGLVARLIQALTARKGDGLAVVNWDEIQAADARHAKRVEQLRREIERNLDDPRTYI